MSQFCVFAENADLVAVRDTLAEVWQVLCRCDDGTDWIVGVVEFLDSTVVRKWSL